MSKTTVVTTRIPVEQLELLDRIASAQNRSRAWVIARAIERQAKEDSEFLDFLQEGIDDLDAGRTITHDQLVEQLKARRHQRKAA